jgi:hypothetical protein
MKFIAAALLGLLLPGSLAAAEIPVRAFGVILSHDDPELEVVGKLRFRGGLDLRSSNSRFGGLSGLDISPDGAQLTAIGDRGVWFSAQLSYGSDGNLTGISGTRLDPVLGADGTPLTGRNLTDSESIARLTDGTLVVGFEQQHRLRRFTGPGAAAEPIGAPPALGSSPPNGGAEAVTRLWGNQLLVLSERLETQPGIAAGWIGSGRDWRPVGFRRKGLFRPVGAATREDDGAVFILERRFTTIGGIASRISSLPGRDISPGGVFEGRELAELSPPLVADNFEGIAVRRGKDRETLIYIVSDDNFYDLQRTLLLMFSLAE